jgi:hypothetical protein
MEEQSYNSDIEEKAFEEEDQTPLHFWEEKQREVILSVVDYNLGSLADLIDGKTIDLSPKYQRRDRWNSKRQSKLIESFLMNVPVPPIFLNEDKYGKYSVIDGKQRLSAIHGFMRGRFRLEGLQIFSDINGMSVDDLPDELQQVIKVRPTLRAVIILRQSDQDVKFEVFRRLNTGGVSANDQEIRNSTWPGSFNDLVLELSELKQFHEILRIKNKHNSKIYQEMRDAELVLRFFTFRETWQTFEGRMKNAMDTFMAANQKLSSKKILELKNDFLQTLTGVQLAFGEHAFQRWIPENSRWRPQVLAALYDAEIFACRGIDHTLLEDKYEQIIREFKKLFEDPEFRRLIDAATNTPSYFKKRIETVKDMITRIIKA